MSDTPPDSGLANGEPAPARLSRDEVAALVTETLCEMFQLNQSDVTMSADLRKDLGLDSIDAVDMAAKLQQLTRHRVPLSDLISIHTVSDVVDLVATRLANPVASNATGSSK